MYLVSGDGREGKVWVKDGVLIHAWTKDGLVGEEALMSMLNWSPGTIQFVEKWDEPTVSIGKPLQDFLLEVEGLGEGATNIDKIFEFSVEELLEEPSKKGGEEMAGKNMEKVLEALAALSGFEGAAVVSDEGLILASKFVKKYAQDKVAALVSETLNLAKKVVKEADWGDLDNMLIESGKGSKMVIYKTDLGFIVLIGSGDLNLGLARVTVDEAAETLDEG